MTNLKLIRATLDTLISDCAPIVKYLKELNIALEKGGNKKEEYSKFQNQMMDISMVIMKDCGAMPNPTLWTKFNLKIDSDLVEEIYDQCEDLTACADGLKEICDECGDDMIKCGIPTICIVNIATALSDALDKVYKVLS